TYNG
ncbi:hypothetical protein D039_2737B, partial [Vibrio parahaemolyticus EKP-028]